MADKTIHSLTALAAGATAITEIEADDTLGNPVTSSGKLTLAQLKAFISPLPLVDIAKTFTQNIAAMGLAVQFDHLFGTATSPGPGQTAINNAAALTANGYVPYAPFPGNGGYAKLNGEPQIYMPFSATSNFVFNATDLALTATLDASQTANATVVGGATGTINLNNTSTAVANFNIGGVTTGIVPGQLVLIAQAAGEGKGLYIVTAVVANTSITIGTIPGGAQDTTALVAGSNRAVAFMPWYAFSPTALTVGNTTITFTGSTIPAGVIAGMSAIQITSGGNWDFMHTKPYTDACTVQSVVTGLNGSVVVSPAVATTIIGNSSLILFGPMIRSAQIYLAGSPGSTPNSVAPGRNGVRVVAYECTFKAPRTNAYVPPGAGVTQTQFNAIGNTAPVGAWPAHWLYSNYNYQIGGSNPGYNSCELDIFENTVGCNQNGKNISITPHGAAGSNAFTLSAGGRLQPDKYYTTNDAFLQDFYTVSSTYPLGGVNDMTNSTTFADNYPSGAQFSTINFNSVDIGDNAFHTSACIWTADTFYWYIDNFLVKFCKYTWSSLSPPWLGLNLGCGAMGSFAYIQGNMIMPLHTGQFPMVYNIQRERCLVA